MRTVNDHTKCKAFCNVLTMDIQIWIHTSRTQVSSKMLISWWWWRRCITSTGFKKSIHCPHIVKFGQHMSVFNASVNQWREHLRTFEHVTEILKDTSWRKEQAKKKKDNNAVYEHRVKKCNWTGNAISCVDRSWVWTHAYIDANLHYYENMTAFYEWLTATFSGLHHVVHVCGRSMSTEFIGNSIKTNTDIRRTRWWELV